MSEETIYQSSERRSRTGIASYLRRRADKLSRGEPVPDDDETVTVDPLAESQFEVEVDREEGMLNFELEIEWPEKAGSVDPEAATRSDAMFERYEDKAGEYRWRLHHSNGNSIADSGEGYTRKAGAKNGIESVKKNALGALVDERA